jgi:hypothetical protein
MLEQKWQKFLFLRQKQENDWAKSPNEGALRCVTPAPLSRLAGYALAVDPGIGWQLVCLGPGGFMRPACQRVMWGCVLHASC